ncbi:12016_t:CDS:2 [Ambispora leptoticha]|uniref:12016_t:CDS:1 n=1 Tax=Ambispora leptoticha TaxID=144679 RepID=A0A9N9HPL6_9GLOM|nr:12016_t:CDS:2 [Ambispora leptoticha]
MAKDKWPQLREILESTDNHDTLPTNRPLHEHYFERDEFQNRGTIHTHSFAYTEKKTPKLIYLNLIRADVPDPQTEPELHRLVTTFQIHHCDHRCRAQGHNNEQCSKGFPQPLSQITYYSPNTLHYIYRRTKKENRMVIPYHPETLLIWRGHINFQYITTTGFAKYITKYVTKPETSELFDINESNEYRRHIMARRLGAMELIVLLLQHPLTRCSVSVHYLPSAPSELRLRSVKPIHLLNIRDDNNDNDPYNSDPPYWDDSINKYFDRSDYEIIWFVINDLPVPAEPVKKK